MKKRNRLFLFCLLLPLMWFFHACNSDRIFEDYLGMESLTWAISDTVSFELTPVNTEQTVSTIGIRYNDSFEFHNLYVRFLLKDSIGQHLADSLINIDLFDSKTGKPLGDGFGNVFTKYDTLPLTQVFENQKIKVQFIQYMRKDNLQGIEAVGLKIIRK
ncbi:MAG: gliding motility lipoprotein GldH [Anditalea sp.]